MTPREDILDDELLRETPGLRPFSVGILKLCRKMGLAIATPGAVKPSEEVSNLQILIIAWMLDERHPLETVRALPNVASEHVVTLMEEYEFTLEPAFLARVTAEIARTQRAVAAAAFSVEAKPGSSQGPSPSGKS